MGPCEDRVKNCLLRHQGLFHFFKILIGSKFSEALLLPPTIAQRVKDWVNQEIILDDSSGTCWTVTLSDYSGSLAFHKGWYEFSAHKNLQIGDALVFCYIKAGHFFVLAFGRDGGVKENSGGKCPSLVAAEDIPCQKIGKEAGERGTSSPSNQTHPTKENCISSHDQGGEKNHPSMDDELIALIDRDDGNVRNAYANCLYDLSVFEMQQTVPSAAIEKAGDTETSSRNLDTRKATQRVQNVRVLQMKKRAYGRGKKGAFTPSVREHRESSSATEMRKQTSDRGGKRALEPSLSGGSSCSAEMRIQASGRGKKRALGQSVRDEGRSSSAAAPMNKVVKTEPVDPVDVPSFVTPTITCLAESVGRCMIHLPDHLPSVTFRSGEQGKASITLQDPKGKEWPSTYLEKFGSRALLTTWPEINAENGIQPGDHLVISVVDASQNKYKFDVLSNQAKN